MFKSVDDQSVWRKGAKTVTELSIDDGTGGEFIYFINIH